MKKLPVKKLPVFLLLLVFAQSCLRADELVPRRAFFEHVMGMKESQFQADDNAKRNAISQDADGVFYLTNQTTGQKFRAGKFETRSIADLRKETDALNKPGKGTFNVIEAIRPEAQSYYQYVDVGSNQANPQNNDAVFQVASNFNALELTGTKDTMESLEKYIWDWTQGPYASMSAAPGLILRHYGMFFDPAKDPSTWQQYPVLGKLWEKSDADKQINLLEDTDIPVENSYVNFARRAPQDVKNYAPANMKVAWHENIQVTSGLMTSPGTTHMQIDRTDQFVNQVFTASVPFDGTNPVAHYLNNPEVLPLVQPIAQAVLDAAYEGTIRAAALHKKKKIFLSLIGGGAFNNKLAWIANAIEKMLPFIVQSGLEVTLIIFDGKDGKIIDQMPHFRERMIKFTEETGGTYTQYSPDHPEGEVLTTKGEAAKKAEKEADPLNQAAALIKAEHDKDAFFPFADAVQILHDNKIQFESFEDAQSFFAQKTHYNMDKMFENRKKLIESLVRPVDEKPLDPTDEDKIVALLKGKPFFNVHDILQSNNISFISLDEGRAILEKAGFSSDNMRARNIDRVIKEFIKPSALNDDTLINALNNLASALQNAAREI